MSRALRSRANEAWPSGTVTFVFTDIEGSTRLWSDAPEAMAGALARHDEIVQTAVASHHGVVFSTSGDGLAACFTRAADAVGAALAAQVALGAEPWPERCSAARAHGPSHRRGGRARR